MTLSRMIPTVFLLAGAAAAQPPAPPRPAAAPRAVPAQERTPRPAAAPRAVIAPADDFDAPMPPFPPATPRPALAPADDFDAPMPPFPPATPRPAAAPRAKIAPADDFDAPMPPEPPEPPFPPPTPRAALAPEPPDPPEPAPFPTPQIAPTPRPAPFPVEAPFPFDQDRLFELQDKLLSAQDKMRFDFDVRHKTELAMELAAESMANLKMNFPAFAPQVKIRPNLPDDSAYQAGQRALEGHRYGEALEYFNQVASRAGNRADGALYWKAYTLIKLGRPDEARAAIAELRKSYASSRWLDDAKALEVEAGKPVSPESESDEELKLIALNGLMQSDPDRALPLLDTLLKSAQPPKIRRQAIYVLAASNSPKAQQMLEQVARGQGNPDLQLSAIRYLGERRRNGGSNPALAEIYASSNDVNVKRAILASFESAHDKDRLLQIAKTEKDKDVRLYAIRMLGGIQGAQPDLWSLYQAETSPEVKQQILESIPSAGNLDKMLEIARTERDPKLRRFALQQLGGTRAASIGDGLVSMYSAEQDEAMKRTIIDVLSSQRNVKAIIQIGRSEKDPKMRQRIVEHLANMKSPEATDYLLEILNK